ncbi:UNVERIFIED_CONTAM: hypothetical protein FKN15_000653 [Acipenser sinensis]
MIEVFSLFNGNQDQGSQLEIGCNCSTSGDGPLHWEAKNRDAFTFDIDYKDGALVIRKEGHYFIYSIIFYGQIECQGKKRMFKHYINKKTERYSGELELMENRKIFCSSSQESSVDNSFLGGVFHLLEGDQIFVKVIAGAGMDVDFTIAHPEGFRLVSDFRKSDGIHTIETTADGDYEICFDNSFSRMSEKMVFFEVITEGLLQDTAVEDWAQVVQPEELVDFKLDDIRDSMDGVRRRLERSMQMQTMLRAFEARDRNLQEDNLSRVTFWSSLNMLVMMVVALVQVYLLRSLFNDKRRVRT